MFGPRKNGLTRPFTHADSCKILAADPTTGIMCQTWRPAIGRQCVNAGRSTFTRRPLTAEFGLARLTRPPSATRGIVSIGTRPIPEP
jgi:hypothetical protein